MFLTRALPRPALLLFTLAACSGGGGGGPKPSGLPPPVYEDPRPGPGSKAPEPAAAPPATASEPKSAPPALTVEDAAKKYVAEATSAWLARDPKKMTALYTADAVIGTPGPKGWEEAKAADTEAARGRYFAAFPDLKVAFTRVIGNDRFAVAEWTFTGTNTGEVPGQKATGKKVGFRGASVLTFAPDGKVRRESVYFDVGTINGQLGLGPKGQPVRPAAGAPTEPPALSFAAPGAPSTEPVARLWLASLEKGAAKELVALATDDIVVSNQYMPADTKGKKALEKELAEGMKAFVDQKVAVTVCIGAKNLVACEYTWQATWKGRAMGMKPTGKTGTVHSLEVVEVLDGKVARTTAYANSAEFAATFGVGG